MTTRIAPTTDAPTPDAVADALRRGGLGEVDTDTRRRAEYSSDASLYRVVPTVVAYPRDAGEVEAAVAVARDLAVPVTARGAGTSIAGNAVGTGIVLEVRRHLDRIVALDPDARTARVQPGVVLDQLQAAAAPHGLRFGPDPSTHDRCTIGGMIGNDACGSRALGYGRTSDNVLALDVVTGAGERLVATRGGPPAGSRLAGQLDALVDRHEATLRGEFDRFGRQVSGYALHHLLPDRGVDLARALVGSEGTCALTVEATVHLRPVPARTLLVALGYADAATAADAVPALLPHRPVAVEGLDARIVAALRARRGPDAVPPLPRGAAWLFVELAGDDDASLLEAAAALTSDADALEARTVTDPADARQLWRIREDGAGLSSRSVDGLPAHAGWEDAAVPPARLGAYLRDFDALLLQHGLTTLPYGHFGDGCLHARIDFPLDRPGGVAGFRRFLEEAADLVASHGGSMSGEHGDGRARSELLPRMYSADAIEAFGAFARAFDPDGVLNPGVLVAPRPLDADLRVPAAGPLDVDLGFTYAEDRGDLGTAVHRCIGIGRCVSSGTTERGGVMCPSFLATGDERDSTRGRARVLQELANGSLIEGGWSSPEVHESLDLCLACKGCSADCPAEVDVATYKAEVLHQTYRGRPRPRSHYALGQLPRWARLAGIAPGLVARAMQVPALARIGRWAAGVDQRRALPAFSPTPFSRAVRHRPAGDLPPDRVSRPPVLLWVDSFSDRFDPEVAVATVRVLEDAGFRVEFPDRAPCCGLTWISTGQLDAAKRILRDTVDQLAEVARAGTPIVGLEPPCVAVLRDDAPRLLGEDDAAARDVAAATRTLAELLQSRRPDWSPPRLDGVRVLAQPHCHHHAVMGWGADRALLTSAGATVETVGGCCGLAGNFGAERGHHEVSVAVAETALLPAVRAAGDDVVLLADGFSCRTQLDQLADRRAIHLAQLLAAALPDRGGRATNAT
ncbi:FAD-binding and (Fe-S)-binding domain-containing protein [Nitriliruptor alkaliphilus]|uniref:FAD-binding and (Fe-S)-binding domain-containing protein n=1 Tax=Nitriliruptor alkaliphilus TaxID=427918 RepID=UPI000A57F374|nr:FAD-binding and (Fe-S)-binding domain-containing protein [Nitriliruptor alkaliphilus]